jgi:hypothetical protein
MDKEFLSYQIAVDMKSIGFDEPCFTFYPVDLTVPLFGVYATLGLNGKYSLLKNGYRNSTVNILWSKRYKRDYANVTAPTYSQAFRFFREKYQLHSTITSISQESWQWHITKPGESLGKLYDEDFYTYEEAELACLKKLIEIVKSKLE